MAKTKISEFNANPALNTDIDSINIAEGCAPSGINDAIRELMSQLKDWQSGTSNDPMVIGSSGSLTLNQGTANGVAYLNGSKVVTSGSALTFDGTNWKLGNPTTVSGYKAQIYGDLLLSSGAFGSGQTYTISLGDGNAFMQSENGQPVAFGAYNGFKWGFASTDNKTISSEWMRLTSTGLGIGTSSPTDTLGYGRALDIQGTLGSALYARSATNSSSVYGVFAYDTNAVRVNVGAVGTNNYLRFVTAVGEAARIDSSGNLGLGVTPSAWGSAWKAMQISTFASFGGNNDDKLTAIGNNYYNDGSAKYIGTGQAALYSQYQGAHRWSTAASGTAGNAITFTQAMTLDASGRLLVGLTSGTSGYNIEAQAGASGTGIRASNSGGGNISIEAESNATSNGVIRWTNDLKFISGSERARIDSSGNLLVGTTTSRGRLTVESSSGACRAVNVLTGSGTVDAFTFNGGAIGSITTNGVTTAYNTSSDYRLKNTIAPMTGALAKVAALKPVTYKWNADGSDGEGFIAHELAEVVPQCVTGEKDAVDADGKPQYQGIDTSFLVATLTAAIQELKAEFDAYKASHP